MHAHRRRRAEFMLEIRVSFDSYFVFVAVLLGLR